MTPETVNQKSSGVGSQDRSGDFYKDFIYVDEQSPEFGASHLEVESSTRLPRMRTHDADGCNRDFPTPCTWDFPGPHVPNVVAPADLITSLKSVL